MKHIAVRIAMLLMAVLFLCAPDATAQRRREVTRPLTTANPAADKRKIKVEKPDLQKIREAVLDPKSKFYYPKLMERYRMNDTVMSNEDYRYLYLGYLFQEDYDPYRQSKFSSMTDSLRLKKNLSKEDVDTIKKYTELALNDNPFDLRQMSFLVHVLKEKRKDMTAKIWEYRLEHLLGAIKSTGTGEDKDNAWYVVYPMHEYDLIQLLGYEATNADFLDPGIDYLSVRPAPSANSRGKTAKGFYFNVVIPQEQYELKHPDIEEDEEGIEEEETDGEGGENADEVPAQ